MSTPCMFTTSRYAISPMTDGRRWCAGTLRKLSDTAVARTLEQLMDSVDSFCPRYSPSRVRPLACLCPLQSFAWPYVICTVLQS